MDTSAKKKVQPDHSAATSTLFKDQTHMTNNEPMRSESFIMSPVSQSLYRIYDIPKPYVPYNVAIKTPSICNAGPVLGKKLASIP